MKTRVIQACLALILIGLSAYYAYYAAVSKMDEKVSEIEESMESKIEGERLRVFAVEKNDYRQAEVGESFEFGTWDEEPIEWIVLEKNENDIMVISKDVLCGMSYNEELKSVSWRDCTLRTWLNNDFYNEAFSSLEKSFIIEAMIETTNYSEKESYYTDITKDKVFLLDLNEAFTLFENVNDRRVRSGASWWLRAYAGSNGQKGCGIDQYGEYLFTMGGDIQCVTVEHGVRPSLYLECNNVYFDASSETT